MNDIMVVHLAVSVDSMNFIELLQHLKNITTEQSPPISAILLNFSDVGFLQSTAWNRVVNFAVTCDQSDISVLACHLPSVFQSLSADQKVVKVYADEEAALSSQNENTTGAPPSTTVVTPEPDTQTTSPRETPSAGYLSAMIGLFILWPKASLLTFVGMVAAIALIFVAGPNELTRQRELCERLIADAAALKQRDATPPEWADFLQRSQAELTPIIQNLSSQGNARTPAQTELLNLARHLLKIIGSPENDDWQTQIKNLRTQLQQLNAESLGV